MGPPQVPSVELPVSHGGRPPPVPGSGLVQLPDWQLSLPQNSGPVPHLPPRLQQSPHLPAHWRLPCCAPHVPSVLQVLSPGQTPSQQMPGAQSTLSQRKKNRGQLMDSEMANEREDREEEVRTRSCHRR